MPKNRVQAYLLDKNGAAIELSYHELNNNDIDILNKILWVHFDYSSPEAILTQLQLMHF